MALFDHGRGIRRAWSWTERPRGRATPPSRHPPVTPDPLIATNPAAVVSRRRVEVQRRWTLVTLLALDAGGGDARANAMRVPWRGWRRPRGRRNRSVSGIAAVRLWK